MQNILTLRRQYLNQKWPILEDLIFIIQLTLLKKTKLVLRK